ncbi:hypothetical protein [Paenibacillus riograndensis]
MFQSGIFILALLAYMNFIFFGHLMLPKNPYFLELHHFLYTK